MQFLICFNVPALFVLCHSIKRVVCDKNDNCNDDKNPSCSEFESD